MTAPGAGRCCASSPRPGDAGLILWLVLPFVACVNAAAPPLSAAGRSPSGEEILALPAAAGTLERMPLRDVLEVLARPNPGAIFLDRRINPDALVSQTLAAVPLQEVLEGLGRDHGFAVAAIESVIYLGPEETAGRLRTLDRLRRDEVRRLPPPVARALLADATVEWSDLESPRGLVEEVSGGARVSLANPDQIPHDLWAEGRLPNLPRVTQLTILLAGFDLTFEFASPDTIAVRPIRGDERWQQAYRLPSARAALVNEIQSAFPHAVLTVDGGELHVAGMMEEHEVIREWLQRGRRPEAVVGSVPTGERVDPDSLSRRYTLRVVRRPLGDVLREIERSTPYRFVYDRERMTRAGASLHELTSFDVVDADIDGLVQALLKPAGLRAERKGTTIEITP